MATDILKKVDLTDFSPEQFLARFDRNVAPRRTETPVAASTPALLAALREQVTERFGVRAAILAPRFQALQVLVTTLYPPDGPTALSHKDQGKLRAELEVLFEEMEDILFALTLDER